MSESVTYSVGQKFTLLKGTKMDKLFGGTTESDKDIDIFIGPDGFAHYLDGSVLCLSDDLKQDGFDVKGIAEWIYEYVSRRLPFDLNEMLEGYEETKESFIKYVTDALEELGFLVGGE